MKCNRISFQRTHQIQKHYQFIITQNTPLNWFVLVSSSVAETTNKIDHCWALLKGESHPSYLFHLTVTSAEFGSSPGIWCFWTMAFHSPIAPPEAQFPYLVQVHSQPQHWSLCLRCSGLLGATPSCTSRYSQPIFQGSHNCTRSNQNTMEKAKVSEWHVKMSQIFR